jgi:hypothetical protein
MLFEPPFVLNWKTHHIVYLIPPLGVCVIERPDTCLHNERKVQGTFDISMEPIQEARRCTLDLCDV